MPSIAKRYFFFQTHNRISLSQSVDLTAISLITASHNATVSLKLTSSMRRKYKKFLRDTGIRILRACGSDIVDVETGAIIGRALLFCWRGRIKIIGLDAAVKPVFLAQTRLTYWKQELGFTVHPAPDYPRSAQSP